jgi:kynurenine formamidase
MTIDTLKEEDVIALHEKLSNWGRWGSEDQLGTLNLVGAEQLVRAARLVQKGIAVSCAWEIDPAPHTDQPDGPPHRFMISTGHDGTSGEGGSPGAEFEGRGAAEYFGLPVHGLSETHIDSLCHRSWKGRLYNDFTADSVTSLSGAARNAVTAAWRGVVTRGVLLDLAAVRDVDWLDGPDGAGIEDLHAMEDRQGVTVGTGDAVLLRTGAGRKRRERGRHDLLSGGPLEQSGWHAECLRWFRERGVAAIGSDTAQDVHPSPYSHLRWPVHSVGIVAMGLWLIDNCDLEALAITCTDSDRWEFLFCVSPLRLRGGTGSPVNPIAIF